MMMGKDVSVIRVSWLIRQVGGAFGGLCSLGVIYEKR